MAWQNTKVKVPTKDQLSWTGPELAGMDGLHWDSVKDHFDEATGLLEYWPGVFIPSVRDHNGRPRFVADVVRQIFADAGRPLPTSTSPNNNGN